MQPVQTRLLSSYSCVLVSVKYLDLYSRELAVLVTEDPRIKPEEIEAVEKALTKPGKTRTIPFGPYDISDTGISPGIYKDKEANQILDILGIKPSYVTI